jgi:hypothetical protein
MLYHRPTSLADRMFTSQVFPCETYLSMQMCPICFTNDPEYIGSLKICEHHLAEIEQEITHGAHCLLAARLLLGPDIGGIVGELLCEL